jgi:tetratricopeptide (TPR) repeat protein
MKSFRAFTVVLLAGLVSSPVFASGLGSVPTPSTAHGLTAQERAILSFNDGIKARENAWKLEKELTTESDAGRRTKLESKIRKNYESAVRSQLDATRLDPSLFQAFGELGYAYRKNGNYAAALEAYDHALAMKPNFGQAIEYRAEAYLGLGRTADARAAYMTLFNGGDKSDADQLGMAMRNWLDAHRTASGDGSQESIDEFAKWLAERTEISSQTGSSSGSWK